MSTPQINSEAQLQAACHQWFHNTYPALRGLGFMIHNDGQKSVITANQDKARGLVPGVPDWCLMVPDSLLAEGGLFVFAHALFIEFKHADGRLSHAQKEIHEKLTAQGYRVVVVRSLSEFQTTLTEYLS